MNKLDINNNFKIILLGPPGSGKGTQAKKISDKLNIEKIVLGDIIRSEIEVRSDVGNSFENYFKSGTLVPDELIIKILESPLNLLLKKNDGFVLDGFPRNLYQAKYLKKTIDNYFHSHLNVFLLDISIEDIKERLLTRVNCSKCKMIFNTKTAKPKVEGFCDFCGEILDIRLDDSLNIITKRYEIYLENTNALISFYSDVLIKIQANQNEDSILSDILDKIR